jgi:hypothetical protein
MKRALIIFFFLLASIGFCANPGPFKGTKIAGIDIVTAYGIYSASYGTAALASLNAGWAARFCAPDTRDVKSVRLYWSTISAPGTVRIQIQPIDLATGKPTGTAYDANATIDITPTAGVQTVTFATLPATGLTAGAWYAVTVITTVGGTTQTLLSGYTSVLANHPVRVMTTADAGATWTLTTSTNPVASIIFEDDAEDDLGFISAYTSGMTNIYGTNATSALFTTSSSIKIAGIWAQIVYSGAPPGDFIAAIYDSVGNVVSGSSLAIDKDIVEATGRQVVWRFAPVILPAGTYRIVLSSPGSNSSNYWRSIYLSCLSAALVPNFRSCTTADLTANPVVWDDSNTTRVFFGGLILDDVVAGGGAALSRIRTGM